MWVDATPEAVWKALMDPELSRLYMFNWMMLSSWKRGAPVEWVEKPGAGHELRAKGTVMENIPNHRLRYTFYAPSSGLPDEPASYTTVDITIEPERDGRTLVTVWHGDFAGLPQDVRRAREAGRNWVEAMVGLKRVAEEQQGNSLAA